MSAFILKNIALICMFLDHVKYAIPVTKNFVTEYFGRISFPLFAFLISEGFIHSKSKFRYIFRIFVFAMISEVPFFLFSKNLVHSAIRLNVMFTFILALFGLYLIEFFTQNKKLPKLANYSILAIILPIILIFATYIRSDYRWYGIMSIWIFYLFRNSKILTSLSFIFLTVIYYLSMFRHNLKNFDYKLLIFSLIPLIFICLYNGKKGKGMKYFFYVFYPLHLMVLYLINYYFIS